MYFCSMGSVNNNISPLPFYDDISMQNHRKDYAFGVIYPLITPRNMLLPFQVVLSGGDSIEWARLCEFDNGNYTDVTSSLVNTGLSLVAYDGFTMLRYPARFPIPEVRYEGAYYLAISVNNLGILYSDVFTVNNRTDDFLLIEYTNSYNFELKGGMVDFSDNFIFRCYLSTQVGKPEYDFEEEATERMGYSYIESQVSKKIYKFSAVIPEFLCDALRIVRLCDNKRVVSKGLVYDCITFAMDVDWEDQGDLAAVEFEFETDNVIANIGGYEPIPLGGSFDEEDYNENFEIEE